MAIGKQEFYEGAALYQLVRRGKVRSLKYEAPLFTINEELLVCLKYSTKGRSPWGFTFTVDERRLLRMRAKKTRLVIGLICGADGIAALSYSDYQAIAGRKRSAIHIACYRKHGEHYGVSGPDGELDRKIAPSVWQRILGE